MTTQTNGKTVQQTTTRRGFLAPCPHCAEVGTVQVRLGDLREFFCTNCENEFGAADIREFIATWTTVLTWVESAPVIED